MSVVCRHDLRSDWALPPSEAVYGFTGLSGGRLGDGFIARLTVRAHCMPGVLTRANASLFYAADV